MKKEIRFNKTELSNRIKVLTEEVPTTESFALGFFLNVGSRNDPKGFEGLAHFVEHSAFLNTKTRNYKQIATQFESVGAYTNAFTTKEYTCFYVRALNRHFNKTFQLLADIVFNPRYLHKSIEKEKQIIIEEIRSYEDDPEELIFDYADEITFSKNGLSHPIVGKEDSVKIIEVEHLEEFHKKHYIPQNIVISFAGGLEHRTVLKACNKFLSNIEGIDKNLSKNEKPQFTEAQTRYYKQQFHQSHIILSRLTDGMRSKERYPLTLLNIMLGDGMSSRIYQLLREIYGYAYSAYSYLNLMLDCGSFYVYSAIEKKKIQSTLKLLEKEFKNLQNQKIKISEINRAKEQAKSSALMALESMSNRMQTLAKLEFTLGKYEDVKTTIDEINSVTPSQIFETAEKYFDIDNWNKVIFES